MSVDTGGIYEGMPPSSVANMIFPTCSAPSKSPLYLTREVEGDCPECGAGTLALAGELLTSEGPVDTQVEDLLKLRIRLIGRFCHSCGASTRSDPTWGGGHLKGAWVTLVFSGYGHIHIALLHESGDLEVPLFATEDLWPEIPLKFKGRQAAGESARWVAFSLGVPLDLDLYDRRFLELVHGRPPLRVLSTGLDCGLGELALAWREAWAHAAWEVILGTDDQHRSLKGCALRLIAHEDGRWGLYGAHDAYEREERLAHGVSKDIEEAKRLADLALAKRLPRVIRAPGPT